MGYTMNMRKIVGHAPIFMPASGCFLYRDGKIGLQLRTDNHKWAAHGGSMEFGEKPEDTLKREVREELGIDITKSQLLGVYAGEDGHFFYPNGDEVYAVTPFYLVTEYLGTINPDPTEVVAVEWFALDQLPAKSEINQADYEALQDAIKYIQENKI